MSFKPNEKKIVKAGLSGTARKSLPARFPDLSILEIDNICVSVTDGNF